MTLESLTIFLLAIQQQKNKLIKQLCANQIQDVPAAYIVMWSKLETLVNAAILNITNSQELYSSIQTTKDIDQFTNKFIGTKFTTKDIPAFLANKINKMQEKLQEYEFDENTISNSIIKFSSYLARNHSELRALIAAIDDAPSSGKLDLSNIAALEEYLAASSPKKYISDILETHLANPDNRKNANADIIDLFIWQEIARSIDARIFNIREFKELAKKTQSIKDLAQFKVAFGTLQDEHIPEELRAAGYNAAQIKERYAESPFDPAQVRDFMQEITKLLDKLAAAGPDLKQLKNFMSTAPTAEQLSAADKISRYLLLLGQCLLLSAYELCCYCNNKLLNMLFGQIVDNLFMTMLPPIITIMQTTIGLGTASPAILTFAGLMLAAALIKLIYGLSNNNESIYNNPATAQGALLR